MTEPTDRDPIHRELDTAVESPATQVAEVVADLEGKDPTEVSAIYDCVGGVLDHVFSDPPSPKARTEVAFSYENYRITIAQDGAATFVEGA